MRVYKGFNKKIQAKHGKGTFQYEKGKTYKEEKSKTRSTGFHAAEYILDCLQWYPIDGKNKAETKATIAEHERIDPFYDGVLSTIQTVREYIKKMRKVDEAEGEKQMKEIIADSKFEYIKEIKPFFWWTGSLSIEQAITHLTKRYDEEEAHKLLDEKLEFVSGYMRNNHGAVEQYGIYLLPEFMLGYDDIEIVIVAASENERATVVFSDIPVVKRGYGRI